MKYLLFFLTSLLYLNLNAQDDKMNKKELREYVGQIKITNDSLVGQIKVLENVMSSLHSKIFFLEQRNLRNDSNLLMLEKIIGKYKNEISDLNKQFDNLSNKLGDSISFLKRELKINKIFFNWLLSTNGYNSKIQLYDDKILDNYQSQEWNQLKGLISWSDIVSYDSNNEFIDRKELGNIVILSVTSHHYASGIPYHGYGHDDYNEQEKLYFLKIGDSVEMVNLEDCFNDKKGLLLSEINAVAKKQLEEDRKDNNLWDCGAEIKLPLSFKDLDLILDDNEVCFRYSDGLGKGSLCGGPRNTVCFEKSHTKKFIR